VVAARERQRLRLVGTSADCNAALDARLTRTRVKLADGIEATLAAAVAGGGISLRGRDRVLRIAMTIADLDGRDRIDGADLDEALGYRLPSAEAVAA
jgi:magnesium chelatase family protein